MAEYAPMSELRKPAVCVLIVRGRSTDLEPVFWGMEEEGIPYEVQESSSGEVVGVAKEAAHMSPLNVGIAYDGTKGTIALHHRDLKPDEPLFVLNLREVKPGELRRLGINAARLVKSEPLVLNGEAAITNPPPSVPTRTDSNPYPENVSDELVEQIVKRILAELVKA
jgi:hypothetical protein